MHTLGIDIETYSSVSLKTGGMFRYAQSLDFEILLLGYCLDDGEVQCIDLARDEEAPAWFVSALCDANYLKTAWNAMFELTCFNQYFEFETPASQWECTMIRAGMLGYPMSLDMAGKVLQLETQKDRAGKALIKAFTMPTKDGKRHMPANNPESWNRFIKYNIDDVKVEQAARNKLKFFKNSAWERKVWEVDQKVNNVGVLLDVQLIKQAVSLNDFAHKRLMQEATAITGLENANSVAQLKQWLEDETMGEVAGLKKEDVKTMLNDGHEPHVNRLLEIRQEMAKSSIKKYKAMYNSRCRDGRVRGLFQIHGAPKTGRWSGRLFQPQNLTKTVMPMEELTIARELVKEGNLEDLELLFGSPSQTLSKLIRTAIIPPEDHTLLVSDFSAIEARVLAWLANEKWRLDVFKGDGKIYEASGARMFKVPIEEIVGEKRFRAKTAELALGFQGGVGAIERMESMGLYTGLEPGERQPLVNLWRSASPNIVSFWYTVDEAAIEAVSKPGYVVKIPYLSFVVTQGTLFIRLPSGRYLAYARPFIKQNRFGRTCVAYEGTHQVTKQWSKQETYGGKLVENIVQGTARDVLADGLVRLDAAGFKVVMHVHDEYVSEVKIEEGPQMLKKAGEILDQNIPWALGLPLATKSFLTPFYIKD